MGRPKIDRTGEVGYNKNGEEMRIIRYANRTDIDVKFVKDGTVVQHRTHNEFLKGSIRNPMTPSVYGVGFIGIGDYKTSDGNGKFTKCYITWHNMLRRCYDPKFHEKQPSYENCTVCEEWHNFQNFAQWYYSHFYEIEGQIMNLDKDIVCKWNKVYSPSTCVFVPRCINSLFVKSDKLRGKYPIGVCKKGNKFQAKLNKDNETIHLGAYNTPEEAFQAYKQAKEAYIKEVAEKYKLQIPPELYQALMNYKVEITD